MSLSHFILEYLVFNLILGVIFLLPYYLYRERGITEVNQLLCLVGFPAIGLGLWSHKRNTKLLSEGKNGLPKDYYVLRNLAFVNGLYYIYLFLTLLFFRFFGVTEMLSNLLKADYIEPIAIKSVSDLIVGVIFALFYLVLFLMAMFITVILPFILAGQTKRSFLASELEHARIQKENVQNENPVNSSTTEGV